MKSLNESIIAGVRKFLKESVLTMDQFNKMLDKMVNDWKKNISTNKYDNEVHVPYRVRQKFEDNIDFLNIFYTSPEPEKELENFLEKEYGDHIHGLTLDMADENIEWFEKSGMELTDEMKNILIDRFVSECPVSLPINTFKDLIFVKVIIAQKGTVSSDDLSDEQNVYFAKKNLEPLIKSQGYSYEDFEACAKGERCDSEFIKSLVDEIREFDGANLGTIAYFATLRLSEYIELIDAKNSGRKICIHPDFGKRGVCGMISIGSEKAYGDIGIKLEAPVFLDGGKYSVLSPKNTKDYNIPVYPEIGVVSVNPV